VGVSKLVSKEAAVGGFFAAPGRDTLAGLVVFLVALPLCLGIAVACGVPPVSGLVAGMVGGLVVPLISRAPLSVTGPAAGLTSVVLAEVALLGSLEAFLTATILAGGLQVGFGLLRLGRFSSLVPSAVVKGMLAAIGLTILMKQLPVAFGTSGALSEIAAGAHLGAALIAALSLGILVGWKHTPLGRYAFLPAPLVAVLAASVTAAGFAGTSLALGPKQFVRVPLGGLSGLVQSLPRPDWSVLTAPDVWRVAFTVAAVASIETLLSLQAVDRLDPLRRRSPPDRELVGQGVGNVVSGFLGGLPVTSVIVRSSANVAAGGQDRLSTVVHGALLGGAVVLAGTLLNQIPLACLAAVLLQVGFNLTKPVLYQAQWRLGWHQFAPFALTVGAVMAFDLLEGVLLGCVAGVLFVLRQNSKGALSHQVDADGTVRIRFRRDLTFLSKPDLLALLDGVPAGARVVIDATGEYVDHDVREALAAFRADAHLRGIDVALSGVDLAGVAVGGGH